MTKKRDLRTQLATAVLIGLASVLHIVESLIPPPVPGAKLGLANIASLIGLRTLGFWPAVFINLTRSVIGSLFSGSLFNPTFYLSLAGAISSAMAMGLFSKLKGIGSNNIFTSVVGAITHSVAQIVVASFLLQHPGIWFYLPFLLGLSTITGVFIGLVSDRILLHLSGALSPRGQKKA